MMNRRLENFYSIYFTDDYGFYPVSGVSEVERQNLAGSLEFLMGECPKSIGIVRRYGAYIEHEDFWVVGRTPQELENIVDEWSEDD